MICTSVSFWWRRPGKKTINVPGPGANIGDLEVLPRVGDLGVEEVSEDVLPEMVLQVQSTDAVDMFV
jgi:hypothetical protein